MCSFQLSVVSKCRPRYLKEFVYVAVFPLRTTGGSWSVLIWQFASIITYVLLVFSLSRLSSYHFATVGSNSFVVVSASIGVFP